MRAYPAGDRGALPTQREALVRVYSAGPGKEQAELRAALNTVGLEARDDDDPYDLLPAAGTPPPDAPEVHPLRLALAAMHVLADGGRAQQPDALEPVVERLLRDRSGASAAERDAVRAGLAAGAQVGTSDRWAEFRGELRRRDAVDALDPELVAIRESTCSAQLLPHRGEVVSRIETRIVVGTNLSLNQLAPTVMPQNWPRCNDFFLSLTRRPELDARLAGATGGELGPSTPRWVGVFQERVGGGPDGWFPDTNLAFHWDRRLRHKILLCYRLLPPVPGERTVISVDQGFLEVQRRRDSYEVRTLKYLLFDEQFLPPGGQVLGSLACELGWLDQALNQFTVCGRELATTEGGVMGLTDDQGLWAEPEHGGLDAELQRALSRSEAHLRQTAAETAAQYRLARERIRSGEDTADAWVADAVQVWQRGVRDTGRAVQNQALLARGGMLMLRDLARTWIPK